MVNKIYESLEKPKICDNDILIPPFSYTRGILILEQTKLFIPRK